MYGVFSVYCLDPMYVQTDDGPHTKPSPINQWRVLKQVEFTTSAASYFGEINQECSAYELFYALYLSLVRDLLRKHTMAMAEKSFIFYFSLSNLVSLVFDVMSKGRGGRFFILCSQFSLKMRKSNCQWRPPLDPSTLTYPSQVQGPTKISDVLKRTNQSVTFG